MSQQPQTAPSAPDSPALVVTANVQKYAVKKKKILNAEEMELYELTQAAGITVDQEVFKWVWQWPLFSGFAPLCIYDNEVDIDLDSHTGRIIVDLLKMNVAPQAVFQTLKAMCAGQRVAESNGGESVTVSQMTSIATGVSEARGECWKQQSGKSVV